MPCFPFLLVTKGLLFDQAASPFLFLDMDKETFFFFSLVIMLTFENFFFPLDLRFSNFFPVTATC